MSWAFRAQPAEERAGLVSDRRGAVVVEHLIVFVPVLFFFLATLQLIDLCIADLVMKSAASVAVRAASVILPANPAEYGGAPLNQMVGMRRDAVVGAARMMLGANSHFDPASVSVEVTGAEGRGPVRATVSAKYRCMASFVNVICGGSSKTIRGAASDAYHGAGYQYE
jgi:hypothetical protein